MKLPVTAAVVVVTEFNGRYLMIEEDRGPEARRGLVLPFGRSGTWRDTRLRQPGEKFSKRRGYDVEPIAIIALDHGAFREPGGLLWWRFVVSARPIRRNGFKSKSLVSSAVDWCDVAQIESMNLRNRDAVELCRLHESSNGLSLDPADCP